MNNDLAGGHALLGEFTPTQLFAGEAPITTNDYGTTIDVVKYQVVSVNAAGAVVAFDAALPKIIASQPGLAGDRLAFFDGGNFNHEALVWPETLTTFDARRAAFGANGTVKIGRLIN